jgi:hypothetical protein
MYVFGDDIEKINDSVNEELKKLNVFLFSNSNRYRDIDMESVKVEIDKIILELKRYKRLKERKRF